MIRGCERRIIKIENTESELFEEAYFVLRQNAPLPRRGRKNALMREVSRIVSERSDASPLSLASCRSPVSSFGSPPLFASSSPPSSAPSSPAGAAASASVAAFAARISRRRERMIRLSLFLFGAFLSAVVSILLHL